MIEKDLRQRLKELQVCLRSIELSLNEIKSHQSADLEVRVHDLQPQLRQLIATGGKNFRPRLFTVANERNIPLEFYALREQGQGLAFTMEVTIIGHERTFYSPTLYFPSCCLQKSWSPFPKTHFETTNLNDWMNELVYQDGKVEYNRNKLLRAITDKDGGGHLDDSQDPFISSLQRQVGYLDEQGETWNLTGRDLILIDFAILVLWLGKRMLLLSETRDATDSKIRELDFQFDSYEIIYLRDPKKMGIQIPRMDSWGYDEIPQGQKQIRIHFSREKEWWMRPGIYTKFD